MGGLGQVVDGGVDAVATDHAPHSEEEALGFEKAPFGVIRLRNSFADGVKFTRQKSRPCVLSS